MKAEYFVNKRIHKIAGDWDSKEEFWEQMPKELRKAHRKDMQDKKKAPIPELPSVSNMLSDSPSNPQSSPTNAQNPSSNSKTDEGRANLLESLANIISGWWNGESDKNPVINLDAAELDLNRDVGKSNINSKDNPNWY